MSETVLRREPAVRDLKGHYVYIGQYNENAAERFLEAVEQTIAQLVLLPGRGVLRDYGNPDLVGMRMRQVRGFEKYLIFYMSRDDGIEIIRVLHSARDIQSLFGSSA